MSHLDIFSYPFAIRALIAGAVVSVSCALLGVNLVLKRFSMLGDGLSHVSFGSAAIALSIGIAPLKISVPVVIIAAFLLLRLNSGGKIKGDSAIAIVSSGALAVGITVASMTTGMNTDISNYMFGSIVSMSKGESYISVIAAVIVAAAYILFYNKIFAVSFDSAFATSCGVKVKLYDSLMATASAVLVVIGMKMMGALLISSIIIFPALSSMRIFKSYKAVTLFSVALSLTAFLIGIFLSFFYDMPAGASVVIANLCFFITAYLIGKIKKR